MTQYFETSCPHCRHGLRVRVEYIGQWVCCKHCNRDFVAQTDTPLRDELATVCAERDRLRRLIGSLRSLLAEGNGEDEMPAHPAEAKAGHASAGSPAADLPHVNGLIAPGPTDNGKGPEIGPLSISGYEILGTISEGAMGRVYRARQTSLDRIVAIKVLDSDLARNPEYRMRFGREARLSARLSHPNIITTIDAGEVDGHPYFVMEYVDGKTVEDALARQDVFDERMALRITLGVAEAVEYLHAHGLLHRDVKPSNVILAREGGVRLADFGLARSTADLELAAVEEGKAVGTPEYISPEQVNGDVEADIRSDIYSLGASLYRMVTGRVLHAGATSREVMRKHADRETPLIPPRQINPAISSGLNALILKMLARDRDQRYRDPAALILDLLGLLNEAEAQANQSRPVGKPAIPD